MVVITTTAADMATGPPPLPPRTSQMPSSTGDHFNGLSAGYSAECYPYAPHFQDPRSSSTQSLRPVESVAGSQRTLLVIYIHGFLGDETSFKNFPAHVHNLLILALAETHVVYTKIYPRYKSRRNISYARDDFSAWWVVDGQTRTLLTSAGLCLTSR